MVYTQPDHPRTKRSRNKSEQKTGENIAIPKRPYEHACFLLKGKKQKESAAKKQALPPVVSTLNEPDAE